MATKFERVYSQIKNELVPIKSAFAYSTDSEAFGHYMLKLILGIDDYAANEALTDGFNDNGIDALYIDKKSGKKIAHFFQFKFPSSPDKISRGTTEEELLKLFNGFELFISGDSFSSVAWNDLLLSKHEEIKEEYFDQYVLHVVRFSSAGNDNVGILESKAKNHLERTGDQVLCEYHFAKDITTFYERSKVADWPSFTLHFKKDLSPFGDDTATIMSYFVGLYELYVAFKDLTNDIFDGNVRFFDADSVINEGISQTLNSEDCKIFHLLNNGITIVCRDAKANGMNNTVLITNGSVINGAQTVGCILRAIGSCEKEQGDLSKFKTSAVFVKIIKVENRSEQSLIDRLVYTLNTQNPMKSSYSISNDPQIKLVQKEVNESTRYFLQIKNNEYEHEKDTNPHFDKLVKDIINLEPGVQSLVSFYNIHDLAAESKNNKANLFSEANRQYIIEEITKEKLLESYELFLKIMEVTRQYRAFRKDSSKDDILHTLEIGADDIDKYRFINTGNYLILFALGEYSRHCQIDPKDNIVVVIKLLASWIDQNANMANLTRSKDTFDSIKEKVLKLENSASDA